MKRLVRFKLNFESKWLTYSGVMMGIAFFLQALDYFAFRTLRDIALWQLILFLILPMILEVSWCIGFRSELWSRAEVHGVFACLICMVLLAQTVMSADVFTIVLSAVFLLVGATTSILICFGFIPHRALGLLVFAATAAVRVLAFTIPRYVSGGYMTLVREIPPLCMILALMLLFGGIRMGGDE